MSANGAMFVERKNTEEMNWNDYDNFSKSEFDCKHTGKNEMKKVFMDKVQQLRTLYGKPMVVTSGYRDYSHPVEARKSKRNGTHPLGLAADFEVDRQDAYRLAKLAFELGFTGIGFKQKGSRRFIHLDVAKSSSLRVRPTIWSY